MEETKNNNTTTSAVQAKPKPTKVLSVIYTTLILNWKWFLLSLIICVGCAAIYLRYATPIFSASEKMLIKTGDAGNSRGGSINSSISGVISTSSSLDNEMEILTSHSLGAQAVKELKLYATYYNVGKIKDVLLYKTQPISVDMDDAYLEKLNSPVNLLIERKDNKYHVTGTYYVARSEYTADGPFSINKTFSTLPASIGTKAGILRFTANSNIPMTNGQQMKVILQSPLNASYKYVGEMTVGLTNKTTTIVRISMIDENTQRAIDYLRQIVASYNKQANDDKNEVAMRTEEFINGRIEKINAELGNTEGQIENFKKRNGMVELKMNATNAVTNSQDLEKQLDATNTQYALFNEVLSYINNPNNRYQVLPVNIGIDNSAVNGLINEYNTIAQRRNLLLQSASETSPTVVPLTTQLDQLMTSIKNALVQTRKTMDIQRNGLLSQYGRYQGQVGETPSQERILTQIGRQQEVKSGLYLMLLQKREENSISLAATADKGKIIDGPTMGGKVSPDKLRFYLIAFLIGLALPSIVLFIIQFFRYKIEGHDDLAKLTRLPILADVAIASDVAKTKADIVVHENKNNTMEEIFRTLRTNLQFMLGENEKVILCTSTTSGEGKTFVSSNLAMSFALLGKKVLLIGLDIRKPRLTRLFGINDEVHGITKLLIKDHPTWEQIEAETIPSGINDNLILLPAGPVPPNPAELVERPALAEIFKTLRDKFDYIIVDSAPAGIVTDTLTVARECDMTIYMCRADFTPKESIDIVNDFAQEDKLPKVSIVLNGIDMSKRKYGYYYGYGKYGKYSRYGYHSHHSYGYGSYTNSHYGNKNDNSIKK